jgi:hypothetical protein
MPTVADALAWERSQLGHVGGGKYWQAMGYGYTDATAPAWCLCFQCACFKAIGLDVPGLPQFGCSSFYWWLQRNRPDMLVSDPRPGDLVLYDWGIDDYPCDHVGMVQSDTGSTVVSYEGNTTGNAVAIKTRSRSNVRAFVRPPYDEEDIVTDKDKREIAQMAADMVMAKLSAKNANGVPKVAELVLGARNKSLESVDFYQIVRDIRNALGIQDGQKVTKTTPTNVGYDRSVIKRIADKLGVK